MPNLKATEARKKLKVRPAPYFHQLDTGQFLGFRRGPDTWLVRYRDRGGKQVYKALGELDGFSAAKAAAEEWLSQLAGAATRTAKRGSVKEAAEAYVADLRRQGRADAADDAEMRFKVILWDDVLAGMRMEDVRLDDLRDWQDRARDGRKARSVNRHARTLLAALRWALKNGFTGNPAAFELPRLADDTEDDGETAVFLTPEQRAAIIAAAYTDAGLFFRGLELCGGRPGELARATVKDLNGDTLKLSHRKGRPAKLRSRTVILSDEATKFFKAQAKDKLPTAFLFTEDGRPWQRYRWSKRFRAALEAVNAKAKSKDRIPTLASAYSFRHAYISTALQELGIDPVSTAIQCGTSVQMIEKFYHRFIGSAMREKLNKAKAA